MQYSSVVLYYKMYKNMTENNFFTCKIWDKMKVISFNFITN